MTPHPTHPVLAGLTPQQAQAAIQSGPVLVLDGAGTGKTKTLTAAVGRASRHHFALRVPARLHCSWPPRCCAGSDGGVGNGWPGVRARVRPNAITGSVLAFVAGGNRNRRSSGCPILI